MNKLDHLMKAVIIQLAIETVLENQLNSGPPTA